MDIKQRIIEKFNVELGSDLKGLVKIHNLHKCLRAEREAIEKSLSMASSEAPSKVKSVIQNVEDISAEIVLLCEAAATLHNEIEMTLAENEKNQKLKNIMDKIAELEKALSYLNFIKCIEEISDEIEASLSLEDHESVITSYMSLTDISCQLQTSVCNHLINYVKETLHFWHNLIKEKLSVEYNDILKVLKWPFISANVNVITAVLPESMTKFKILTEYLLHLQLPEQSLKPVVTSALLTDFAPVSLPISLLVKPLRLRFIYHFTGSKLTNRQDKPEWFFTQILTWIKDHVPWVQKHVQPVANSVGFKDVNLKVEFMRALVQLAVEKLYSELSIVQYDDALFAHLVDEALGFERELRETLLYPQNQPATVFILTQATTFVKWINMEKKYATEKMDAILNSNTAWERFNISSGIESGDMKVTECTDAFLTLLTTISDRYKHLPQPGHRLQFLELQLELIDDWRVRLLQILHEEYEDPLSSHLPLILNSFHYVANVLEEWGVTVHFLQLQFYKKQYKAVETAVNKGDNAVESIGEVEGSVFDESVALLRRLEKELIIEISNSVALDVRSKTRPYRTDKWFAMQSRKEIASLSVNSNGCPMFQELAARLQTLHTVLAMPLFNQAWKHLATILDKFLLEEVVLSNHFNTGGAEQLQYDIFRNLFPLFGLYVKKPELHFPLMKEACVLLNILVGSAMLLLETLKTSDEETVKEVLADVGVYKMEPKTAVKVLEARTNILYK
ncbi:RAD50-interacting protein 1 isoform X1 [Prorops nasuta]|uniref:RAD50-interacting protein 1 isoform X1 n=1 Tax=Prorops nasuta TaxID=863751 RepID=UPI0034CD490F